MIIQHVVMREWMLTDDIKSTLDTLALMNKGEFTDIERKNNRVRLHYTFKDEPGKLDFKRAADNFLYNRFAGD